MLISISVFFIEIAFRCNDHMDNIVSTVQLHFTNVTLPRHVTDCVHSFLIPIRKNLDSFILNVLNIFCSILSTHLQP